MRNFFLYTFLTLVAVSTLVLSDFALAASQEKPLMVIRFAGEYVDYGQSLDKAIKMSLDKKSTVFFDVVVVTPETMDRKANKRNVADTTLFAEKIVEQIKQSGVPREMVRISFKTNTLVQNNEIQIFVQ